MKYLVLTIITFFLASCHTHKPASNDDNNKPVIKEVVLDNNFVQPKENADFKVLEASIEGDVLTMKVSYSGGCKTHVFNAYFNGMYMKSMPPKASIYIEHINDNDLCKELITEEIQFNLTNVKSPGTTEDYTVMVGMTNYEGYLEYKY